MLKKTFFRSCRKAVKQVGVLFSHVIRKKHNSTCSFFPQLMHLRYILIFPLRAFFEKWSFLSAKSSVVAFSPSLTKRIFFRKRKREEKGQSEIAATDKNCRADFFPVSLSWGKRNTMKNGGEICQSLLLLPPSRLPFSFLLPPDISIFFFFCVDKQQLCKCAKM